SSRDWEGPTSTGTAPHEGIGGAASNQLPNASARQRLDASQLARLENNNEWTSGVATEGLDYAKVQPQHLKELESHLVIVPPHNNDAFWRKAFRIPDEQRGDFGTLHVVDGLAKQYYVELPFRDIVDNVAPHIAVPVLPACLPTARDRLLKCDV